MEIEFYGANCFRISTKKTALVVDDNLVELGAKSVTKAGDANVGEVAHDQGARPVIVAAGGAVVAGEDTPKHGAGIGIEGIPVGIAAAHVHHAVLHRGRRGDARRRGRTLW